tara:strand:- start:709 stop:1350 length:642 start_codon:yes stop_codon:yes gene_type:complete
MPGEHAWLSAIRTVHVIGAGLNEDRPANRSFHDMRERGYRMVPVHPRDAGSSILGRPIMPHPWSSGDPEMFVLFLSPQIVLKEVRKWVIASRNIPFLWLQPGAESEEVRELLDSAGLDYSAGKCWVTTSKGEGIECDDPIPSLPWLLQTTSKDGDECSVWRYFPPGTENVLDAPLEWVGDLLDLETSLEAVPRYIRTLVREGETLEETAIRLS